jgi:methylated-DNA-[protein]-cysteine S-methyltransferase
MDPRSSVLAPRTSVVAPRTSLLAPGSSAFAAGSCGFDTAIGSCGIAWTADGGICGVALPEPSPEATLEQLRRRHPECGASSPPPPVQAVIARIARLLDGRPDDLRDVDIDVAGASEFARQVWSATRDIGPGCTTTYGEIARRVGSPDAAREVGQALGSNPVPIIVPCHRVVGAGGKLVGFSAPGGVTTKLRILGIERAASPDGQTALF